jgi:hypothetical protein
MKNMRPCLFIAPAAIRTRLTCKRPCWCGVYVWIYSTLNLGVSLRRILSELFYCVSAQLSNPSLPTRNMRQTLMVSASLASEVERLASQLLASDHVRITVGNAADVLFKGQQQAGDTAAKNMSIDFPTSRAPVGFGGCAALPPPHLITQVKLSVMVSQLITWTMPT